jgi:hypothetical protein
LTTVTLALKEAGSRIKTPVDRTLFGMVNSSLSRG